MRYDVGNHARGLAVGADDGQRGDLLVGNGLDSPLQLDEKLLEVLSPVLDVLLLAVAADVRPQSVNAFKTALMAARTF